LLGDLRVVVVIGPGLDAGVEIEHAVLLAPGHHVDGADLDREIEDQIARPRIALKHRRPVLAEDGLDDIGDALGGERRDVDGAVLRIDDGDAGERNVEMALDQRQGAARNRAVADEQDAAVELEFPAWRHDRKLPLWRRRLPEVTETAQPRKPKIM